MKTTDIIEKSQKLSDEWFDKLDKKNPHPTIEKLTIEKLEKYKTKI